MPKKKQNPPAEMPKSISMVLAGQQSAIDSASLLSNLIDVWGGAAAVSKDIYAEFQRAPAGGQTRQRILEMMQRLIINNTAHDLTSTVRPSDMTDGELEDLAMTYVKRLTDAVPSSPPAAAPAAEKETRPSSSKRADTEADAGGDGESDGEGFTS